LDLERVQERRFRVIEMFRAHSIMIVAQSEVADLRKDFREVYAGRAR
jgi:hypothetical protein